MATLQEYYNRYDRIRSRLTGINAQITFLNDDVRRGAVLGPPDNIGSRADALDNQIDSAIDGLNALSEEIASSDLTASQQETLQRVIEQTGEGYLNAQQLLVGIRRTAQDNEREKKLREQTQPKNSAGDIVDNEQDAQEADAKVQTPQQSDLTLDDQGRVVPQPENVNTGTNAREPNVEDDTESNVDTAPVGGDVPSQVGGATPVVKSEQTQKTNPTQPAAVADNDDRTTPNRSSTATTVGSDGRPTVAKEFLQPIVSKPNLLSGLSSMTYSLSLYLMSPDEFRQYVTSEQKILTTDQLLIQSGGINEAERNEWFNVDFYIENFTLESVIGTQSVGSPHNAITLEFSIIEPQGITLLNRLSNAVIQHIGQTSEANNKPSAYGQTYLMVIRFYGYDAAGNAVSSADLGLDTTTDSDAIIEKFIPFNITNINYKITSQSTEYKVNGVCTGTDVAFSTARGSVPFNIQITASTIDQLFNGNLVLRESQNDEDTASGNNQNGTTQTVVSGLTQAINEFQQKTAGISADIPDQYEIVFQDPDLKNAKIIQPGNVSKNKAANQTAEQSARKYLTNKLNYDKESRSYNILAGTQIVQLIDLVLRTSTYITSQQDLYIDEKTGKPVGPEDPNGRPRSVPTVQWYRIKTSTVPLGYDTKRKTQAYKITYYVSKYQINTPRSPYFPNSEYRGVHKLYNYWFTGQNTEVLNFEIDVNANYYSIFGNDLRINTRDDGMFPVPQLHSAAPGQSQQGGERGSTIPAANLSDRLYHYSDVASSEVDIVGDPDWIQQTELVYNKNAGLTPFAPDGSVNYDSSEVLFEIRFNPVQDYDLRTGLTNVYENNKEVTFGSGNNEITQANVAQETLIFSATTVTSMFSEGKFTQKLRGVYRPLNSSKNAPENPQAQVVLSNGNTVEQSLAQVEKDNEPTGAIVGGVQTDAGGAANRSRAQAQRNNLNTGSPRSGVITINSSASASAGGTDNRARAQSQRVQASANQSVDDDAGTETTRVIGGRSARARR